jgi:hypothetical protein
VDIKDFDPDDIEIKVEGGDILLSGRREVQRGNSSSVRILNQKLGLPQGVDVDQLSTEVGAALYLELLPSR